MSNDILQLDATQLYCPEWALPVRTFLNKLDVGSEAHIVTKEPRGEAKLKMICASYGWGLKGPVVDAAGLIHFMVNKTSEVQV
jgi:TusA-related sulfurtransferase